MGLFEDLNAVDSIRSSRLKPSGRDNHARELGITAIGARGPEAEKLRKV